jgi:uncharacterized BrkB/YihY/UPF0761 family membrane protein
MMTKNRELAAAFGVLIVAWELVGHTIGFFIGLPAYALWFDFVIILLVLIFTPAVMKKTRWTAPGAVIVGVIKIMACILAATMLPMSKVYGPAVSLVLALLFTYFSFRAYQEK